MIKTYKAPKTTQSSNWPYWIAVAVMYASFFSLIGWTVYLTQSAYPLFALLLTPSAQTGGQKLDELKRD